MPSSVSSTSSRASSTSSSTSVPRLTRAAAAALPKITEATHFLLAAPLDSDDEDEDEEFDPDAEDSFMSDDEPDLLIPAEEFDPHKPKGKACVLCKGPPVFDDPDVQKRADELEAQYQAALEASRSAPSLSTSDASDEDESIDTMQAEEEVEHVGDVTRKVDGLTLSS